MDSIYGVANFSSYKPSKPIRDEAYRRFIRMFPCMACNTQRGIDACHTGPHGLGQKASDLTCIPLCHRKCHPEYDSNPRGFAEKHGLDVAAAIVSFNCLYDQRQERRGTSNGSLQ